MSTMNVQEQFNKMSLGEKIIVVAGPLFFIFSFLPWFDYDIGGFDGPSRSGWSGDFSFLTIIATLAVIVMVAQIVIARFTSVQMPALPQGVTWGRVHLGIGIYVVFAVAIRLLIGESAAGFDADRQIWLFVALICAGALAAGGFLMFQDEQRGGAPAM
jgi:hypothetical protein